MKMIMQEVFEHLDKAVKESDNSLVMLAIEFSPDGFPISKTTKVSGSPASSLAGLTMMRSMIDEQIKSIDDKLEMASSATEKLEEIMNLLRTTDVNDERLKDFIDNTEEGGKLKELIKKLKKDFGK